MRSTRCQVSSMIRIISQRDLASTNAAPHKCLPAPPSDHNMWKIKGSQLGFKKQKRTMKRNMGNKNTETERVKRIRKWMERKWHSFSSLMGGRKEISISTERGERIKIVKELYNVCVCFYYLAKHTVNEKKSPGCQYPLKINFKYRPRFFQTCQLLCF